MRYKGYEEYVLITGYIDTGLLDCFMVSAIYMRAFSRLGTFFWYVDWRSLCGHFWLHSMIYEV